MGELIICVLKNTNSPGNKFSIQSNETRNVSLTIVYVQKFMKLIKNYKIIPNREITCCITYVTDYISILEWLIYLLQFI